MATNRNKVNSVFHRLEPSHLLLLQQTNEKVTALFHKIHNLQIECQAALTESHRTNDLLLRILERPEDRVDAAAELARERDQRIKQYAPDAS